MTTLGIYFDLCRAIKDILFANSSVSELPDTLKIFVDKNYNKFDKMKDEFADLKDSIEQYIHELVNDKICETSLKDDLASFNSFTGGADSLYDLIEPFSKYYAKKRSLVDSVPESKVVFTLYNPFIFIIRIFAQDYNNTASMLKLVVAYLNAKQTTYITKIDECKNDIKKTKQYMKDVVENTTIDFNEKLETIKETESKDFEEKINESQKKVHEINISILGIFSAIVLTFNASISFFAAILESLATASTYKFILIILMIGFITTNIMFGLYAFLSLIYKRSNTKKNLKSNTNKPYTKEKSNNVDQDKTTTSITTINVPFKQASYRDTWKFILPMLIANLAFLVSFIVLFAAWNKGVIEDRNFEVSSSMYSKTSSLQEKAKNDSSSFQSETYKNSQNNLTDFSTKQSN